MRDFSKIPARSWMRAGLELRESAIHGTGVFTKSAISVGEIVIIWGGVIVRLEDFKSGQGVKHTNVGVDDDLYLAAENSEEVSMDDYMNHSCEPNLWLIDEVTVVARRDIQAGEELTIDYATELADETYQMKTLCNCRSNRCRRVVTGKDWQLTEIQEEYGNHFAPFLNRRIERLGRLTNSHHGGNPTVKALITGGSRGIGKAIARELAIANHDVLLVARNTKTLESAAAELKSGSKGKVLQFACDLKDPDHLSRLRDYCGEIDFAPDVLVLNAGIFIEGTLTGAPITDFEQTLEVNFMSIYRTVNLFMESLRTRRAAKIILIGSTAAYEPYPVGPLYGVAKWALRGYATNLRRELMKDGIAVTFLAPGGTLTDLWAGESLPPNRLLEPSDIGKLVAAILSLSNQAVVEELVVRPMLGDIHE